VQRPAAVGISQRIIMFRESKEYSLAELLEHPVIGFLMTSEGIERRCVELMLDTENCERRRKSVDDPVMD
jgi:hypothetical protein